MATFNSPLTFTVRRHSPELIVPEKPTPRELKPLSDVDDQPRLRLHAVVLIIYRNNPQLRNRNPASVIRSALSKLLVFYYPFAGRVKELPEGKLVVDCTGEGVLFIEAEADVTLSQLGDPLQPPFPEELVYDVPGSNGVVGSPLLAIQVTRLKCGGFICTIRLNHTISDGTGIVQFLLGLSEIARGATSPSTLPVWQRELLCSNDRPRKLITAPVSTMYPPEQTVQKSLFITKVDVSALRRLVPTRLQSCSTVEVVTACLWRCRSIALQPNPEDEMPMILIVNARKMINPPLPTGYYGNVLGFPVAVSRAQDLCNNPLGYALERVTTVKSNYKTKGYIKSISDLMATNYATIRSFTISDLTRARIDTMDFGWGKAVYGGVYKARVNTSYYVPYTNNKGESGIMIPVCLPNGVMERFVKEVNGMLAQGKNDQILVEHKSHALSKI